MSESLLYGSTQDPREQILVRLLEIMSEQYVNARTVVRNRDLLKNEDRPAISILDGDERARLTGDDLGRGNKGRPGMTFQLMTMTPEIYILPDSNKPSNAGVGEIVNDLRMTIIRTIAQDPVLLSILGSNGSVAYLGMQTDLKSGSRLDGQSKLDFAFTYMIDPS